MVAVMPISCTLVANFFPSAGIQRNRLAKVLALETNFRFLPKWNLFFRPGVSRRTGRSEMVLLQHTISAGLAIIFSIRMFFASHLFIEARSAKHLIQGINASVLLEMSHQKFLP
jgi:hypothetical protein